MGLKDELQNKYNEEVFRALNNFFEVVLEKKEQTQIDIVYGSKLRNKKSFLEKAIKTQKGANSLNVEIDPCPPWITDFMVLLDEISEKNNYTRGGLEK